MPRTIASALLTLLCFSSPLMAQAPQNETWIQGTAVVLDGDSIEIDGLRVRLFGIDAPETEQLCYVGNLAKACGEASTQYLSDMIYGQKVRCLVESYDEYGRALASCIWNGRNINEIMVLTGNAVAWTRHTDFYVRTEHEAKSRQVGIWATDFATPERWRQAVQDSKLAEKDRREFVQPSAGGGRKIPFYDPN